MPTFRDLRREVSESAREINFFGLDPTFRMASVQKTADAYLKARQYRQRSLKDLSYLFALSDNEDEKTKFRDALERFPDKLPYEYQEQIGHDETAARLTETAQVWSKFWKTENYGLVPVPNQPGMSALTYRDPEPVPPEIEKRREENTNSLRDSAVFFWVKQSLENGKVEARISLPQAISFAKSRDLAELFKVVAEAGTGMTQSCVVAVAAMAIRFSNDSEDREWGWSVMDRVDRIAERENDWRYNDNPLDPRLYYIVALKHDLACATARPASAARLLTLAGISNWNIARFALTALLDPNVIPQQIVWNAAILATDLYIAHRVINDDGSRDESLQEGHRTHATARALARLRNQDNASTSLTFPPAAWVRHTPPNERRRRRQQDWAQPDPHFEPYFAKDLIPHFPIESWAASAEHLSALLAYADELVRWTADRLFPSWEDRRDRERAAAHFYEWMSALATFVAHVAILVSSGYTRFIEPITNHVDDVALTFLSDVTKAITTRHVYDAPIVTEEALSLLRACMDRMLAEHTFDPDSYRAGEIDTRDLYPMVTSFLLISVKDAPGAARFANGDWTDIPQFLPLIDKLMMAAGWSPGVMEAYLVLCERATANFPVDIFTRHVSAGMDTTGFRQEIWNSSGTSAAVSGAIQRLAEAHRPLTRDQARSLLILLDRLVDMGDRRAAALQQSEHFRNIQIAA
jgi:hypothetical protein